MKALFIEGKEDTPQINFDPEKGVFELTGRSLPEDTLSFYGPVYEWLEEYIQQANDETNLKLKIDYFNSASHKAVNEILQIFSKLPEKGKNVTVFWHYLDEDEDMHESGIDFQDLTGLSFVFKSYSL
ncbi:MAG: DUF1987 domain-containing protein [Bacteroidota bacterium]|nr:MAG: DUF1987 domain-containing protein [Bacteroidota bacterium]